MARIMNHECARYRPLLAEHLTLATPMRADLTLHLDQCPDCTRETSELDDVVRTLRRANPVAGWAAAPGTAAGKRLSEQPTPELGDRIRRNVAGTRPVRPHRPRHAAGVLVAAALAVAMVVPVSILVNHEPSPATSVALIREDPMISHPWGTEIPVTLSGLEPQETYQMMVVNADGERAPGGSVQVATDEPVATRMTTAMPKSTITALVVEDDKGRTVLSVPVEPLPTT